MTGNAQRARALLRLCCNHGCTSGPHHACDQPDTPEYPLVEDPGPLAGNGPLAPPVLRQLDRASGRTVTRDNTVRVLVDGVQSYAAMLDLVARAEHQILFENFIFRSDTIGIAFADELKQRAREGVDVRVLHDPFGSLMTARLPIGFRFHRSPVHLRAYNPPRPSPAFFRAGRDHRKLIVQDRRSMVLGGMCIADMWLGNCVRTCTWRDSTALVAGSAACEAADEFERMWMRGRSFTPHRRASATNRPPARTARGAGAVPVRVLADEPRDRGTERVLAEAFAAAESEILITNPYVVLPRGLERTLTAASRRGIAVRILTPRLSNHHWVGLSSEHRFGRLLDAGVEVWHWTGPLIHAKTVTIDRCWSLIGSTNLDPLSLWRNAELNVEIHGSAVGAQLADLFAHDLTFSQPFTREAWHARGPMRRWLTRAATTGWTWQ